MQKKQKNRIALIGDSMTEMIHVNEGDDIGSLIQNKLPNFEIINFSAISPTADLKTLAGFNC